MVVRGAALLALSFAACAPNSVSPTGPDGGAEAGAAREAGASLTACATPVVLFEDDVATAFQMQFARVANGYVGVSSTRDGAVFARAYDAQWRAVGDRLALPSRGATGRVSSDALAVSFEGERGAVSYGASVHELRVDGSLQLTLVRSLLAEDGGALVHVHGAFPRTDDLGRQRLTVITSDGSAWQAGAMGLSRVYRSTTATPIAWGASVVFDPFYDSFTAYEGIPRRDVNNEVRTRRFVPGHGMMNVSDGRLELGSLLSPAVRLGDSVWRMHYLVSTTPSSTPNNTVSLVERSGDDGTERSRLALTERGSVTGAMIAPREGSAAIDDALLAWTSLELADNAQPLTAQWGPRGERAAVARATDRTPVLHGAWVEASGSRGWLVYGMYERGVSMPRRTVFARCVDR
jgi:hypothetical protein